MMHSAEIDGDLWMIFGERYKTKLDHVIPLSAAARALIGDRPAGAKKNSWFVFSTTGGAKPFSGFSKAKADLDKAIAKIREAGGPDPNAELDAARSAPHRAKPDEPRQGAK
jgi:hypothetical protein